MSEFQTFIIVILSAVGAALLPMLLLVLPHNWGWDEQRWAGTKSQVIGTAAIAIGQAVWFYVLYLAGITSGVLALALICGLVLADGLIGGWCILLKHSHPETGKGGNYVRDARMAGAAHEGDELLA